MNGFINYLPYFWILLGFLLVGSELLIPGFVIFFFGLGSLITGILTAVIPGLKSSFILQVLIWLGASALSLFTLRKYFARVFKGRLISAEKTDDFAGQKVAVIEAIGPDKPGRIRFQGTSWRAVSYTESFQPGESVEILEKENLTFVVTKSIIGG